MNSSIENLNNSTDSKKIQAMENVLEQVSQVTEKMSVADAVARVYGIMNSVMMMGANDHEMGSLKKIITKLQIPVGHQEGYQYLAQGVAEAEEIMNGKNAYH